MMPAVDILISAVVLGATCLQTYTSLRELGAPRKAAVVWWNTEDELLDQIPFWKPKQKLGDYRALVQMRPEDIHREIWHMRLVLVGWMLLDGAAGAALAVAIFG